MIDDGVPLISPVEESRARPAVSVGEPGYVPTTPPVDVGVCVVIAVPISSMSDVVP